MYEKDLKRKHSEWKEPYEMLNGAKPQSNKNSWAEEGQRKSPKMKHSNRKGALQKPLWAEPHKMLKSSTRSTQTSGIFVKQVAEMLTRTKPQEELGTRFMTPPPPPHTTRKHSELKEPYEMLNKTKTLTTIARQKMAKEKALKWTSQTGKKPYQNHSEKNSHTKWVEEVYEKNLQEEAFRMKRALWNPKRSKTTK